MILELSQIESAPQMQLISFEQFLYRPYQASYLLLISSQRMIVSDLKPGLFNQNI